MLVNSHSYYSLRYGVLSPKEWLAFFESQPWNAMAITDINNTSACMTVLYLLRNHARKRPVIGVDFRNGIVPCYVALAKNWEGFRQINDHLSEHLHRKQRFSSRAPVAALKDAWIIYPLEALPPDALLAPNELIGVGADQLRFLHLSPHVHRQHKLIAMPTATFRGKRDHNAHRLLRAIDENTLLSKLSKDKQAKEEDRYLANDELLSAYVEVPYLLRQAQQVLEDCKVLLPDEASLNLQTYTGSKQKDLRLLKKLAYDGIPYRYPTVDFKVKERIEKELELIAKKNFVSYFLINWDIVNYAQKRGYFYVGRGSGANSIVAYLLKITDVDPIELDLYFERFINLYRTSPPDFDLDFSWRDRDDITQYIFKRFPHTALLATYNTFQYRAVVRELGKVFGLPKHEIDKLSRGKFSSNELDQLGHLVLRYSTYIQGFPSHLSIHAGGILIADEVQPGFGRCGETWWGHEWLGISPDVVTLGKPMANGHPVAAVVARAEIMAKFRSAFGYCNTFGGNPVSCAAAVATLDVIEQENLIENAMSVGAVFLHELHSIDHPSIASRRGRGLFLALELETDGAADADLAAHVVEYARNHGLLMGRTGRNRNILKLRPPMPFSNENVAMACDILQAAFKA